MISAKSLERIPDLIVESPNYYLVVLDFEGKVVEFNRSFEGLAPAPTNHRFSDFLFPKSASEFNHSRDQMLKSPKSVGHLLLDHVGAGGNGVSEVCWEFSVIAMPEVDEFGLLGIGVDVRLLAREMPLNSLVDVLGFGKIELDRDFKILAWNENIAEWFAPQQENWSGKYLMDTPGFSGLTQLDEAMTQVSVEGKPKCFSITTTISGRPYFAALLSPKALGYHLFLISMEIPVAPQSEKCLVPTGVLSALPGAVFVLDRTGRLSQQNEEAKNLGRIWKGRAYSEGHALTFPNQSNRFSKVLRAIEDGKRGTSTDLDLKMLMPGQEFSFWSASVRPINGEKGEPEGILIQVVDLTSVKLPLMQTDRENERLRELALSPSHILRGPLSSIIGLLELIDAKQLDKENRKLFSFLKPLVKELDQIIRQHAKKMSTFD